MKTNLKIALSIAVLVFVSSCKNEEYQKTEHGLQYKIISKGEGKKPVKGDILTMHMVYKTSKDSIIFDSYAKGAPIKTPLMDPSFVGGIEEGFAALSVGDSAELLVPADSLFTKTFKGTTPPFIEPGSMLTFYVKLISAMSKEEMDAERKAQNKKNEDEEVSKINEFLKSKNITVSPTAEGIYIVETKAGSGPVAKAGDKVSVNYTGRFLDGKVFDSSTNSGKPIELELGKHMVIEGWEIAIATMKKGSTATIVIPSRQAYGEQGFQNPQTGEFLIAPFTPLTFDIELVDIKM